MPLRVSFVTGESTQFEGTVDQLSGDRRTAVGGMVQLKLANGRDSVFVALQHIVYAMNTD